MPTRTITDDERRERHVAYAEGLSDEKLALYLRLFALQPDSHTPLIRSVILQEAAGRIEEGAVTDFAPGEEDDSPLVSLHSQQKPPWENDDGSTNVEGFLAAYAADDNNFWRAEIGHVQNVLDHLIEHQHPKTKTYKILRFTFESDSQVIRTGLTQAEAQEWCHRDDTHGDGWFDGYEEER